MRFPYGRCARSLVAVFTNDAQSMRCHRIVSGSFSTQTEQRRLGFYQPWKRLSGRLIFFKLRLGLDKISRIFRAVEINCLVGKAHMSHLSQRDGTIIILRTFRFDPRRLPRCPLLQFQKEVLRQVGFPKAQRHGVL